MTKQNVEYELANAEGARNAVFGAGVMRLARAKYSFTTDGGAISTITPDPEFNTLIPDNAVVYGGTINSTTACVGSSGTCSVGTSAGSSTTAMLGATNVSSLTLDALIIAVPTPTTPVKLTAEGWITFSLATTAFTAGVIEVTLLYFVADN